MVISKKLFLAILLLGFSFFSLAQDQFSYGLRAGAGLRNYHVGILGELKIIKPLFLQIEANYSSSNRLLNVTAYDLLGYPYAEENVKLTKTTFQIPIMAKIMFGQKLKFYTMVGIAPYLGLTLKANAVNENLNVHYVIVNKPNVTIRAIYVDSIQSNQKKEVLNMAQWMPKKGADFIVNFGLEKTVKKVTPFVEMRIVAQHSKIIQLFDELAFTFALSGGVKF